MTPRFFLLLAGCVFGALPAFTQTGGVVSSAEAQAAFETEQLLIAQAREAAGRGDLLGADALLASQEGLGSQISPGVLLARRAVAVCGWLRNDNEYGRAMRVAERALAGLEAMKENSDADLVERLYWEAVLQGDILDQKEAAVTLLQAAEQFAPDDDRILECQLQWAQALAEFGR